MICCHPQVLKCCNNEDIVTLKADDNADAMTFMFENQSQDRISDFELKLMDIDSEHLGIPGDAPPSHAAPCSRAAPALAVEPVLARVSPFGRGRRPESRAWVLV